MLLSLLLRCNIFPLLFCEVFGVNGVPGVRGSQPEDVDAALYEAIVHQGDNAAADSAMFAWFPVVWHCAWAVAAFGLTFVQKLPLAVAVKSESTCCISFTLSAQSMGQLPRHISWVPVPAAASNGCRTRGRLPGFGRVSWS